MLGCQTPARDGSTLPPVIEIRLVGGEWFLEGRVVADDAVDRWLAERAATAPKTATGRTTLQARVRAEPDTPYERVIEALERCQRAGIAHVEVAR